MSSVAPVAGKLSQIFPPRNLVFISACLFGIGGFIASQAQTFDVFIIGRVTSGVGAAGLLTISIILVLELTGKKRRGLFIGLLNAGYTSGVALGAVIAGALVPTTGWVRDLHHSSDRSNMQLESALRHPNAFSSYCRHWSILQHSKAFRFWS